MGGKGKAAVAGSLRAPIRVRRSTVFAVVAALAALAAVGSFFVLRRIADEHGKRLEMQRTLEKLRTMIREADGDPAKGLADAFAGEDEKTPALDEAVEAPDQAPAQDGNLADAPSEIAPEEAQMASAQAAMDAVKKAIASHDVVVFSKTYCPYCRRAKDTLAEAVSEASASAPHVVELDTLAGGEGAAMQDALRELTGQSTVPNVFIRGQHVGGSDTVAALHREHKLIPRIRDEL